jgi:hypothetical protein
MGKIADCPPKIQACEPRPRVTMLAPALAQALHELADAEDVPFAVLVAQLINEALAARLRRA